MASDNTRQASHAGSWYEEDGPTLSAQLDRNLDLVPNPLDGEKLPIPGARVIIAPHAGYGYSGKCAAWAYKILDLTNIRRVFVLGPSHSYYLHGCAVTSFDRYETPLGDLVVDRATAEEIKSKGNMPYMPRNGDISEHSLEMHMPYLYKRMEQTFGPDAQDKFPPIVPLLVGAGDPAAEKETGRLLAPYLADPSTAFVVSSDFCHWGYRFSYTPYSPTAEIATISALTRHAKVDKKARPIHETIKLLDDMAMDAIETGKHDNFAEIFPKTNNTVCGRHPIAVTMAAMEELPAQGESKPKFKFVRYERSSLIEDTNDSSVSYAAAYAVV